MNNQKKRLKIILTQFKGNQKEFGETIGKSKQTISGWLSGRFPIPEDAAITIEMVHGFRREWILSGNLPMRTSHTNFRMANPYNEAEINLFKKILSNKPLRELLIILSNLPKNEFQLARTLLLSLVRKHSK
ncbi:helix-turn-helix domain-containing protein [Leptospira sp. 201903070]|uniref:Helix-turn-helix domain-containing protein n=1 Tax=Leptospira ainlahdjerensis TaxID=2810033 RepID=A0ABS2U7M1_9LEPT|nr:helix-turn-helix domain-containing protein [Leptospira ainlahdjerensis]MBM9576370.1 helix-turn-helix domain-containing protein [Leptospira ainlahdjerensis]